jgi:hypothetical protein
MTVVLYDKLANREEYQYAGENNDRITLDKTINGVEYTLTYDYQFLDKKRRPVYVESKRVLKKEGSNGQ